jgi:hypothetical protein
MAEAELQDAAAWYDERSPGLGLRFVRAVRAKVDQVGRHRSDGPSPPEPVAS